MRRAGPGCPRICWPRASAPFAGSPSSAPSRWRCSRRTRSTAQSGSRRQARRSRHCSRAHDRDACIKPRAARADDGPKMAGDRSRYGLAVSALGAIVLAVSVFLPWYALSFTPAGVSFAQQLGDQVASQYGNAAMQSLMSGAHAALGGLAGQQFAALSAHQALHDMNVLLLVLAGLAMLDAILPLARSGASIVVLGSVAAICVLYRMVDPPAPAGNLVSLSLREGSWLALLGALAMVLGGLWPRAMYSSTVSDVEVRGAWSGLSGWTPSS